MTIKVYLASAKKDEELVQDLEMHLSTMRRNGVIEIVKDSQIKPGDKHEEVQAALLESACLIILCVSPAFNASDWSWKNQVLPAMQRHEQGLATVVPVLLRPVIDWHDQPYGKLQQVPRNGKAVTTWLNQDEAFSAVVGDIRSNVESILRGQN